MSVGLHTWLRATRQRLFSATAEERMARDMLRALPFDCMGLVLDHRAIVDGTADLLAQFNGRVGPGSDTQQLLDAIEPADGALATSIANLTRRGTAFRRQTSLNAREYEVVGRPLAAFCLLSFRDLPADSAAVELASLRAERDALRLVLDRHGLAARLDDAAGHTRWATTGAADGADFTDIGKAIVLPNGLTLRDGSRMAGSEAEAMLRRFVETVSETFACLRVGLAIFDRDRRLTLSNPAFRALFDVSVASVSGRPTLREVLDRLREARQVPEQADYPAWRARLFALFDDNGGTYDDVWDLPDGRSLQVVATPHPAGGLVFVFEDITESLAMQRWQSTAVEVRRATFEQMADGILVIGPDGRVRIANPAFVRLWSLTGADLEGMHIADLASACAPRQLSTDGESLWVRIHADVAASKARGAWEARVALQGGAFLQARTAPMPDGSTLVVLTDITHHERIATALEERAIAVESAEKMRDAVVDHLAHRLRTPLNAITGFAEILRYGKHGALNARQADYVARIQEGAQQLLDTIRDLGDLASVTVASDDDAGAVSLSSALRGTIGLLERRAIEANVRLSLAEHRTEVVVWGNPGRIRRAVYRLLAEAIDAAPDGSALQAGAENDGDEVVVWCSGFEAAPPTPSRAEIVLDSSAPGKPRLITRLPVRGDGAESAA